MIIADTHLHLYPHYDLSTALRGCVLRLQALAPDATCVGLLAERSDCYVYRALAGEKSEALVGDIRVTRAEDGKCLVVQSFNSPPLYLYPGRQIVTAERLELLCLTSDADIPDGLPAEEAVARIREVGGIPVLTWAVGKWLFGRARVVRALLDRFGPHALWVGDSAMRPTFWPTPIPMHSARRHGYSILAGTDPLPATGEERVMGRYASLMDAAFDPKHARASMRDALRGKCEAIKTVGVRSGPVDFYRRMTAKG
jgi:hypothetical protein